MPKCSFIYKCIDCGREYEAGGVRYLCPECGSKNTPDLPPRGVLKIVYDYDRIIDRLHCFEEIKQRGYVDLLPINSTESLPKLKVGRTPLYTIGIKDGKNHSFRILFKDDSQNPTYSFKDRASALVSAFARENNIDTIVAASTGNAGSSLAGICASQQQNAIIMVPEKAPLAKLTQIIMYGARIVPVKGTYDEAFDLSIKASEEFGWYNRNTAFNPLTIEGKKTAAYELFDQMHSKVPDRIFIPAGDGVILSGLYKGFEDLLMMKLIDKMPVIVAVQSEKSDNLVRNVWKESFSVVPSATIADSISVDVPRNFYMAQHFIRKYYGETLTVTDEEIINASSLLSRKTGLFAEPAAAAAFAGLVSYQQSRMISNDSGNVVLLTGSGLKDLRALSPVITLPEPLEPVIDNLKKLFS